MFCFYFILKENTAFSSEKKIPSLFFVMQTITSHAKAKYFKPCVEENCILQPI